jgi:uncharacterized membrane protein YeaQ/YmgE (transglycosylase-associated protein family)
MNIILWLILGALSGWIASLLMKTDTNQNTLMDIVLGIVGAFVGGFIMNMFGESGVTGFNIYSLIVSVVGAVVVIFAGRMLSGNRSI